METNHFVRQKHFFNRCDPGKPIKPGANADEYFYSDEFYVDFDAEGLRGKRCIDILYKQIEFSNHPTCQLFTGFRGSGKSTELFLLTERLERAGYCAIYADAMEVIDINNEIDFADVLIALGLAVDKKLDELARHGKIAKWAQRFAEEVKQTLFSDVELQGPKGKFDIGPASTELAAELKANVSFRLDLRKAAKNKRRQILDQARIFFQEADRAVREKNYKSGLVVILDNLEKLSDAESVRKTARDVFLYNSDVLRAPGVHMVYTLPIPLVFSKDGPSISRLYDGETLVLPMVKVRDRQGNSFDPGLDALKEVLLKRLDFDEVFGGGELPLKMLVESCGGYVRDLLRLAQYSIQEADELPINEAHVREAIAMLRRPYARGLTIHYQELLRIIKDQRPERSQIPENPFEWLEEVITGQYAMVFRNDVEWLDIHPLVSGMVLSDDHNSDVAPNGKK